MDVLATLSDCCFAEYSILSFKASPLSSLAISILSLILSSHLYSPSSSPTSRLLRSSSISCVWTSANIFPIKPKIGTLPFYLSKLERTTTKPFVAALLTVIGQGEGHLSVLAANCGIWSEATVGGDLEFHRNQRNLSRGGLKKEGEKKSQSSRVITITAAVHFDNGVFAPA